MLTCWADELENINTLDKLESAASSGYSIGNLSSFLLSIDSLYSLPQPYPFQKITLLIYGILEIKLRVLPLFHNGGDQLSTNNSYHLQLLCLSWQSPIRPVKNLFNLRKEKTISNSFNLSNMNL